jgi:hypothetical protein
VAFGNNSLLRLAGNFLAENDTEQGFCFRQQGIFPTAILDVVSSPAKAWICQTPRVSSGLQDRQKGQIGLAFFCGVADLGFGPKRFAPDPFDGAKL